MNNIEDFSNKELLNLISYLIDEKKILIEDLTELLISKFDNSKESWLLIVGEILYKNKLEKSAAISNLLLSLKQAKNEKQR